MSLIIPYKEKELYDNEGAFIKTDGEIIYTYGLYETFSNKYCNGELMDLLSRCIDSGSFLASTDNYYGKLSDYYEILKRDYNYKGNIEEIKAKVLKKDRHLFFK